MRKALAVGVAASICLLLTLHTASAAEKIKWAKSLSTAMSQAKKTNKLVMLDFYTDWWGWCKRLDKDTYTNKQVIRLSEQVVPVKLNAEKEGRTAAQKYQVGGFPTILFLTPAGEVSGRIGGYLPPGPFAEQMQRLISAHRDLPALEARIKANPANEDVAARLAIIYAGQGKQQRAAAMLTRAEKGKPARGTLAKAYNAVGDSYQETRQFDKAIQLFKKAAKNGTQPYDVAYAHISTAVCYLSQGKNKEAIPALQATIAVPNAPKEMKAQAQQILTMVKQRTN